MKSSTAKWIIGLLIIINLVTLGTFWFGQSKTDEKPTKRPQHFLRKELQLSEDQARQFQQSQNRHFRQTKDAQELIKSIRGQMFEIYFEEDFDSLKMQLTLDSLSELFINHEKSILNHFEELSSITNEDQAKKLKEIFLRGQRAIRRGPPHKNGPPPGNKPIPPRQKN